MMMPRHQQRETSSIIVGQNINISKVKCKKSKFFTFSLLFTKKNIFRLRWVDLTWRDLQDEAKNLSRPCAPEMISKLSNYYTLLPGDIMTGTPAGVGPLSLSSAQISFL